MPTSGFLEAGSVGSGHGLRVWFNQKAHTHLHVAWNPSQHGCLELVGLFTWWLRAPSMIVLVNKMQTA